MALLQCGIVLIAATAVVPSHPAGTSIGTKFPSAHQPVAYTAQQVESYLTAEQIAYIRPGFKMTLNSFTNVAPGQKPVADVTFSDDLDQPLDYAGKATPGPITISFILAVWDPVARQYTSLTTRTRSGVTNPSADQNGQWNHVAPGHSIYTFGTTMPANLDVTKTYTLGVYGRRQTSSIIGKDYYANNINYDFRPDGQAAAATWNVMDIATTCNKCHDPLAAHGGTRRTTKNCVLCHTPQIVNDATTGNTFDFKVMIHKIHMGENLPSVQAGGHYGFGTDTDFSTVALPQAPNNCVMCHEAGKPGSSVWYAYPSRKACGSCHDNVNWTTGENHPAGPQADDSDCASCHLPEGVTEFDASVKGAHTIATKSTQLAGLALQILDVSNTAPGQFPTVTFKLTDGAGQSVDPTKLNRFRFLVGGPTTDYTTYVREDMKSPSCSGGTCTFTFTANAIPADATGTWTLSADYYRTVIIDNHTDTGLSVREAGQNPIFDFIVTDGQEVPRRSIVDLAKCNACHDVLALHGGQRYKVEECVICHNPTATADSAVEGAPQESIHFKWMVHRIHTGEELSHDYSIGESVYNEVRYPGDRRDCLQCHKSGTYTLPIADGALATVTPRDFFSPMLPGAAACLSCHDTRDAAAHAFTMTAPFGEACEACHGTDAEFSVDKVHAR